MLTIAEANGGNQIEILSSSPKVRKADSIESGKKEIFFDMILEICDKSLETNRQFLKENISKARETFDEDWRGMCSLGQQNYWQVRQDKLFMQQFGGCMSQFPLTLKLSENDLLSYGIKHFYDRQVILGILGTKAHIINDGFHSEMQRIFGIDSETGKSEDGNIEYMRGPLKDMERAKEKVELDYADRHFPTSAALLDLVRCSMVFKDPDDVVRSITKLSKVISKKKSKRITHYAKLKNMFRENSKPYGYADLKMSVLYEWEGHSMICEIQFLMDFMLESKKRDHKIYEVVRSKAFFHNVARLSSLCGSPEEEILAIACRKDTKELARFMVNHRENFENIFNEEEEEKEKEEEGVESLVHIFAKSGFVKGLKHLFAFAPSEKEIVKKINSSAYAGPGTGMMTPLQLAVEGDQPQMVEVSSTSFSSF